jgi:hypothetical protein
LKTNFEGENTMEGKDIKITLNQKRRRLKKGANTDTANISIPAYLLKIIDDEAQYRRKSRSMVVTYLVITSLKAHAGEFVPPADNRLKKLWRDRHG